MPAVVNTTMSWRSATWARWLGWTLLFALLFAGVLLPFAWRTPDAVALLVLAAFFVSLVLCPVAAYWIGRRFPSWSWAYGPPVAIVADVLAVLLLPSLSPPRQTALGMTTPKDEFLFLLIWGGWILLAGFAILCAWMARAGVKQGRRHGASVDGDEAESVLHGGDDSAARPWRFSRRRRPDEGGQLPAAAHAQRRASEAPDRPGDEDGAG